MCAIALKEFLQLRRDRRTVAMLFLLPFLFLVVFGYAASFDVKEIPTRGRRAVGRARADRACRSSSRSSTCGPATTGPPREDALRRGEAVVAFVTPASAAGGATVLVDGSELFAAQAALRRIATAQATAGSLRQAASAARVRGRQLPLPPATQAGPRRHRQGRGRRPLQPRPAHRRHHGARACAASSSSSSGPSPRRSAWCASARPGTMEQLAVMPFRPRDVFLGKIAPYLAIAAIDMAVIVGASAC